MTRRKAILTIIITAFGAFLGFFIFNRLRFVQNNMVSVTHFDSLIDNIAETIIPRTNTPGARDAKVSQYIINVIENCTSPRDKRNFISGLKGLESYCQRNYSSVFSKCNEPIRASVLNHFENKGSFFHPLLNKIKRKIFGQSFFEQMKWLTVSGYCQSKLGVTQGLAYDHIPIDYVSCIPYTPNQRSWATK